MICCWERIGARWEGSKTFEYLNLRIFEHLDIPTSLEKLSYLTSKTKYPWGRIFSKKKKKNERNDNI